MKNYPAKTIIKGYEIGQKNNNNYVGVPKGRGFETATYAGVQIKLDTPVAEEEFEDKFGRGKYWLQYYLFSEDISAEGRNLKLL